jgi:hypothetical protein
MATKQWLFCKRMRLFSYSNVSAKLYIYPLPPKIKNSSDFIQCQESLLLSLSNYLAAFSKKKNPTGKLT